MIINYKAGDSMAKKRSLSQKINVLRASVMGANDGIVSVAGIVIGVAGATSSNFAIFISGISGMLAGTVSMAMGEWVSVNTQKIHSAMQSAFKKRPSIPRMTMNLTRFSIS